MITKLLKGMLHLKKVPSKTLNKILADKTVDIAVANVGIGDRGAKGVDKAYYANNKARGSKTICTHVGIKSLRGDNTLQRSVCESGDYLEEQIECQRTFFEWRVGDTTGCNRLLV